MRSSVSLFVFLSSAEAKFESQSHFLWHTLRHTHKRRMRLRGSSAVTLLRTNNTQRISGCRTGTPEHTSGRNGQEARNKCGSLRWWDLNIFEHDRNVIFGSCLRFLVVRLSRNYTCLDGSFRIRDDHVCSSERFTGKSQFLRLPHWRSMFV